MLGQIITHTNAHPYHIQVISFWFSIGPAIAVLALIIFVQYWRIKRNRKSRRPIR